jgi:hypothetical protein
MANKLSNPQMQILMQVALQSTSPLVTGNQSVNRQFAGSAGVGTGAGNVDGLFSGNITVASGSIVSLDLTNPGGTAGIDVQQNAGSAACLMAFAAQVSAINNGDSPTETCLIGGGTNPILAANSASLANGEAYGFHKFGASGGLNISSGAKIITFNASAGTMTVSVLGLTRSA